MVTMEGQVFVNVTGDRVTESMLADATRLFNENYGIWDKLAGIKGRVKLSPRRIRDDYLPVGSATFYASVTVDGTLAGNAFSCRWKHGDKTVCWVTQLVVAKEFREIGLASGLLRALRNDTDDIYGIMSSHTAACLAASKAFSTNIEELDFGFMKDNAAEIMATSPIPYIRNAKLAGSLFLTQNTQGLVAGVDTAFFVDHTEPLEALAVVKKTWNWPLGDLPDGHEFLVVVAASR